MLSYIWQQHCRIVAFSRCLIIKCRMTPFKVVSADILSDGSSGIFDVIVLCQVGFFILEAAKPALNLNVVCPAAVPSMLCRMPFTFTKSMYCWLVNWQPWSEFNISGLATLNAFFKALMTILVSSVSSTSQPTMQRLCQSITAVKYRKPRLIGIYVMSIDLSLLHIS